jgi:hypothetical protein
MQFLNSAGEMSIWPRLERVFRRRWRMAANTIAIRKSSMGQVAFKADMGLKTGGLMRMSGTVSEALLHGEDNLRW